MEECLRCDKCGSSQTSYRVKTDDRICYKCGNIFKEREEKWKKKDASRRKKFMDEMLIKLKKKLKK